MTHAGQALLALAVERFSKLTAAEEKLLCKIAASEVADYRTSNDTENDPTQAETWDASRTIRATVIRWLCVDHEAIRYVDPKGIHIGAAKIDGQLDLAYATVPVPLGFWKCAFPCDVNLVQASTYTLMFNGSFIHGSGSIALNADGIQVNGSMFLCDGFRARGAVRLVGATLTGDLTCNGGTFYNPKQDALRADGAHVSGSMHLPQRFPRRRRGELGWGHNYRCSGLCWGDISQL